MKITVNVNNIEGTVVKKFILYMRSDLRKYERLDKIKRIYDKSGKEYFVTSSHHV